MPTLRLDLDRETFEALASQALAQRRPVVFQAEVMHWRQTSSKRMLPGLFFSLLLVSGLVSFQNLPDSGSTRSKDCPQGRPRWILGGEGCHGAPWWRSVVLATSGRW